ncbi:MAG TPA: zinc-binding dehydrogenase [Steroidobacter sp.]
MSALETNVQIRSLLKGTGEFELSLVELPVQEPAPDEVVVRMQAAPINPSDLALLLGPLDLNAARQAGTAEQPVITSLASVQVIRAMAGRIDQSLPVGNEGAGVVVKAGASPEAQALLGRTVAVLGGAMYSRFRTLKVAQCMPLPEGTKPSEGASCFVNPLTALAMVEVMRRENHRGLVHTVGASNLGIMLNKICLQDGVPLVNIVRRSEHVDMLKQLGARHVCNSSAPNFIDDLKKALDETGATLAFDAIGGGRLASQILSCMEAVAVAKMREYSRYGSDVFKQVYMYGMLDRSPTELIRSFGLSWGVSGWLLTPFLQKIGPAATQKMRDRVVAELRTTFASHYSREISLKDALTLDVLTEYAKMGSGAKYLVNPSL